MQSECNENCNCEGFSSKSAITAKEKGQQCSKWYSLVNIYIFGFYKLENLYIASGTRVSHLACTNTKKNRNQKYFVCFFLAVWLVHWCCLTNAPYAVIAKHDLLAKLGLHLMKMDGQMQQSANEPNLKKSEPEPREKWLEAREVIQKLCTARKAMLDTTGIERRSPNLKPQKNQQDLRHQRYSASAERMQRKLQLREVFQQISDYSQRERSAMQQMIFIGKHLHFWFLQIRKFVHSKWDTRVPLGMYKHKKK